jgi:hypothetical protein
VLWVGRGSDGVDDSMLSVEQVHYSWAWACLPSMPSILMSARRPINHQVMPACIMLLCVCCSSIFQSIDRSIDADQTIGQGVVRCLCWLVVLVVWAKGHPACIAPAASTLMTSPPF